MSVTPLTQHQREAFIDLLLLAMYADSKITLKEEDALQADIEALGWAAEKPREIYYLTSLARARRNADSDATIATYLKTICSAFSTDQEKTNVVAILTSFLGSDGTVSSETSFLQKVKATLNV